MTNKDDIPKELIILYTDLLKNPLSFEERVLIQNEYKKAIDFKNDEEIEKIILDNKLKEKIINLFNQNFVLTLALEKLSQRGIKLIETEKFNIPNSVKQKFKLLPEIFFCIGEIRMLSDGDILVYTNLTDYEKSLNKDDGGILISDRPFMKLLGIKEIINKISENKLLIISDFYFKESSANKKNQTQDTINERDQKNIFISGSRSFNYMTEAIQNSLDLIKKQGFKVLIGDSDKGVDNEILNYFRNPLYEKVNVFSISEKPRVKIEDKWKVNIINPDKSLTPQAKQMEKDRMMAQKADFGLSIFNPITINRFGNIQVSSGTLRNTIQMLLNNKPVKFYYLFDKSMYFKNLKDINQLEDVLKSYYNENIDMANVKANAILKKYNDLMKKEVAILERVNEVVSENETKDKNIQLSFF